MAKQKGFLKIQGSLGDTTFVKTKDGYLVREKSSISAARMATDPAFQRTRENNAEFSRAGKAGKLLRSAIRSLLQNAKDQRASTRLFKEMMKVIKADSTSNRGKRNVIDGETELLQGFNFNTNAILGETLYAAFNSSINRSTGLLDIHLPSFIPANEMSIPEYATHFKIVSAGAEIDFEKETCIKAGSESALIPINSLPTDAMTLSNAVTENSTHPLFLFLGIQYFQEINGKHYPLKNGVYNALSLVQVSGM